jgi:23S rRNA (uracil1939-C5)-methyltransferase
VTEQLVIAGMGHRGDGIAKTSEGPVFVPCALPGETVTVEKVPGHPDRRHLLHVDEPSPARVEPICLHFGVCGGCAVQHWTEEQYRAWKRELVTSAVALAGLKAPVDDLVDAHGAGRRRAVLHARRGTHDVIQVGFAARRTHHIVPIDRCPVLAPGLEQAIPVGWRLAEALQPLHKPLDIQVTATDAGLDVDVRGSGSLPADRAALLVRIAAEERLARLTRHSELLAQAAVPTVRMGRAAVPLPPGAFLQATAEGEAALAGLVIGHADSAKKVADLFCGVGPFALRLAERAAVTAIDLDAGAVEALRRAAAGTSGLRPISATARDLFRRPLMSSELNAFDAVVFDPPRQGAQAQAAQLGLSKIRTVIAVSCNPATFARDARLLVDGGFRLERVTPVDQFRHTAHVELVALFRR